MKMPDMNPSAEERAAYFKNADDREYVARLIAGAHRDGFAAAVERIIAALREPPDLSAMTIPSAFREFADWLKRQPSEEEVMSESKEPPP